MHLPLLSMPGLFLIMTTMVSSTSLAAPDNVDQTRLAIIEEARLAFKKKDYAKARSILADDRKGLLWTIDSLYIQRQRLLGQTLLRLKQYQEAEDANISAFMLDPSLLDVIYDTACALALQKNSKEALKNLEILWYQVADNPTQKKRYFKALTTDADLASLAKSKTFKKLVASFAGEDSLNSGSYATSPRVFAAVGDNVDSGYISHQILGALTCGKELSGTFKGIKLVAPSRIKLQKPKAGALQVRLPICFDYMIFSKDVAEKSVAKKTPDLTWIIELKDQSGGIIKGPYYGGQNSKDHRTGAVIEHPIEQPLDETASAAEKSAPDFGTGGREITDVAWHLKPIVPKGETYSMRIFNDVYESNTVKVKFEID